MRFGKDTSAFQETKAGLSQEYLGSANLIDIGVGKVGKTGNEIPVIYFKFVLNDGDFAGTEFVHNELKPREDTKFEVVDNMINRIGYIMSRFIGDDRTQTLIDIDADNYDELWTILTERLAKYNTAEAMRKISKTEVYVKILPNASKKDGKLTGYIIDFPRYRNFIKNIENKDDLKFEAREKAVIEEYHRFLANRSSSGSSTQTDTFDDSDSKSTSVDSEW